MSGEGADLVVGTAGHIDHGKTSMVEVLTGVNLDRLPEERERGITIALGFADLELPDGRRVAIVDVPGHERLVRTMIAGATGLDAALLCVSALDGVMPQTREHLAILDLLGVREGAVVLTMADLVDEELLELAEADVVDTVAGTFLEGRPILPFSRVDGRGRDRIVETIAGFQRRERPQEGPFRLPVDRSFVRPGFGTVVTGTAWSGVLADGATVTLLPEERTARVRGIQTHGRASGEARAGWRTALNLTGVDTVDVPRGTVVVAGDVPCSSMIDVRYRHLDDAEPLEDGTPIRLLHGTAERIGRLYLVDPLDVVEPGASVYAQLRLDAPLPCLRGDRFVIRRTSPLETLGGGTILDPWAPRLRPKARQRAVAQLRRLEAGEVRVLLERADEEGLTREEWGRRGGGATGGVLLGDRVFGPGVVSRLEGALVEALAAYHNENPLSLGPNRRELRRGRLAHLPDRVFDALIERLAEAGTVRAEGPLIRAAGFVVTLTPEQRARQDAIRLAIDAAGLEGTDIAPLREHHDAPDLEALVHLLETGGVVTRVPKVGLVPAAALADLRRRVRAWFTEHGELTPGDFKELTGLSRKTAIPLLEWLDAQKVTRRRGDVRVRGAEG